MYCRFYEECVGDVGHTTETGRSLQEVASDGSRICPGQESWTGTVCVLLYVPALYIYIYTVVSQVNDLIIFILYTCIGTYIVCMYALAMFSSQHFQQQEVGYFEIGYPELWFEICLLKHYELRLALITWKFIWTSILL